MSLLIGADNNKYCSKLGAVLQSFGCVKICEFVGFYLRGEWDFIPIGDLTESEKRRLDIFFGPHGYTVYKAFCAKRGLD